MSFRPPADAWSRRDFMGNGFGSVALLCTLAAPDVCAPHGAVTSAAIRSQAKSPFAPSSATCRASRSSCPSPPRARVTRTR